MSGTEQYGPALAAERPTHAAMHVGSQKERKEQELQQVALEGATADEKPKLLAPLRPEGLSGGSLPCWCASNLQRLQHSQLEDRRQHLRLCLCVSLLLAQMRRTPTSSTEGLVEAKPAAYPACSGCGSGCKVELWPHIRKEAAGSVTCCPCKGTSCVKGQSILG